MKNTSKEEIENNEISADENLLALTEEEFLSALTDKEKEFLINYAHIPSKKVRQCILNLFVALAEENF